jgi:hypothetical protein
VVWQRDRLTQSLLQWFDPRHARLHRHLRLSSAQLPSRRGPQAPFVPAAMPAWRRATTLGMDTRRRMR